MVYLIYDYSSKLTKIGKSKNPISRHRDLKTGIPMSKLIWYSDNITEKELHHKFKEKRINGEWFNLSEIDHLEIISENKILPIIKEDTRKGKFNGNIIIKRHFENIGWISGISFINLKTEKPLKLKSYNGCLCFMVDGKRIGYNTWKQKSTLCKIIIENNLPF